MVHAGESCWNQRYSGWAAPVRRFDAVHVSVVVATACAPVAPSHPESSIVVQKAPPASEPASPPKLADPAREQSAFAFRNGRPSDALLAYATRYWGPGGAAVFTNPASASEGDIADGPDPERLIEVGQYAVVELPQRSGFFLRDFGERGWVTSLVAQPLTGPTADVVLRYTLRDEPAPDDRVQSITSVAHFVIELWSFRGSMPRRLLAIEHEAWANCCGSEVGPAPPRVDNEIEIRPGEVTQRVRSAWRASAASFHPRTLDGITPLLLPWGGIRARVFGWNGKELGLVREER